MTTAWPRRILSHDSGIWAKTVPTTDRGQDKRAHVALRSVGCFCDVFRGDTHPAMFFRKVPDRPNILFPICLMLIGGSGHG